MKVRGECGAGLIELAVAMLVLSLGLVLLSPATRFSIRPEQFWLRVQLVSVEVRLNQGLLPIHFRVWEQMGLKSLKQLPKNNS